MDKKRVKREALAARRALSAEERREKSGAICMHLKRLLSRPEYAGLKTVFSYRAVWDEADVDAVSAWLAERGVRMCWPISLKDGVMEAAAPRGADAFQRGAYGIDEPVPERSDIIPPGEVDLIIVPCVAFDRGGNRCGHGAGYYDRYIASCGPGTPCVLAAFDAQEVPEIDTEETDVPIPLIVTESGVREAE